MDQPLYRDRQVIRSAVPVIIGAILGGLLTGIPTIWVALGQQRLQLDLARRAEQEQVRQRRVNALTNNFTSCGNLALAVHHLVDSVESGAKITTDTRVELQKEVNLYALSLADVAAEFELRDFSLPADFTLLRDAIEDPHLSALATKELIQKIRPLIVQSDRLCRAMTNSLLNNLRPTSTSK